MGRGLKHIPSADVDISHGAKHELAYVTVENGGGGVTSD